MFEFFDSVLTWLFEGTYQLVTDGFAYGLKWIILAKINTTIFFLEFGWEVAQTLLTEIGLFDLLDTALANLSSEMAALFYWFNGPALVNTILGAHISAWVIRLTPGV